MDTSERKQDSSTAGDPEAQKTVIKSLLNDIAAEIGDAIRNARLNFPVYLTVPNSGDALATIVCPLDHLSDEDWSQAPEIACKVIGKRLGGMRLLGRPLVCAAANPTVAAASEVAIEFDPVFWRRGTCCGCLIPWTNTTSFLNRTGSAARGAVGLMTSGEASHVAVTWPRGFDPVAES